MPTPTDRLCEIIVHHSPAGTAFPMPGVMFRSGTSEHEEFAVVLDPMLCFILQGTKRVRIGARELTFDAPSVLALSLHLPLSGRMLGGTVAVPHVGLGLQLDRGLVADLLARMPAVASEGEPGFSVTPMEDTMIEPLLRLAGLADAPGDAGVLAPLAIREIIYRALGGPIGPLLRAFAQSDGRLTRVRRAVEWMLAHLDQRTSVERLAILADMSVTSFNRHFRRLTSDSPLQYFKKARLYEAHRQLGLGGRNVSDIAYAVGYESPSQFSREYARQFGRPPKLDRLHPDGARTSGFP